MLAALRRAFLAPFAVALALRIGLAVAVPVRPVWDGVVYARVADALAAGEGYTRRAIDPGQPPEPTAFYPVGFSALLAPLRWLLESPRRDLVAQALAGALLVPAAGLLGRRVAGRRAGRRAAWLVALWPGGILLSASWLGETVFALFVAAASLIVAYARRRRALASTALAALVLALGALVRPTAVPMLLALAVGVGLAAGRGTRAPVRALALHVGVALALLSAVLAPWALRNAAVLGGPVLVSTNGGANLLVGARGLGAYAPLPHDLGCPSGVGELERDRCLARLALERIAEDPVAWLARGVLKLTHTFGHESSPAQAWAEATERAGVPGEAHALWALGLSRAYWLLFLAASIAGAVMLGRRPAPGRRVQVALFAPILGLAALHFVFLGGDRYHAPVVPLMAPLAALAIGRARAPVGASAAW